MSILLNKTCKDPIILIDGSYFVFHRFFATLKWYKFRNENVDGSNCMSIEEFRNAIIKHTISSIEKLRKKWAIIEEGKKRIHRKNWENIPIWFALDCHRIDIWRMHIIEGYKGTRDNTGARDAFDKNVFDVIYEVIREIKNLWMLEVDELEADDIIALAHTRLRKNGDTTKIVCITNDNDYLQLYDDNTEIYNLDDKDLKKRSCGDPKKDLLIKILIGDKSDNIKPVRAKLSEKKIKNIIHLTEEEILSSLSLDEQEKQIYELNRRLIDFSYIPSYLVDKFDTAILKCEKMI